MKKLIEYITQVGISLIALFVSSILLNILGYGLGAYIQQTKTIELILIQPFLYSLSFFSFKYIAEKLSKEGGVFIVISEFLFLLRMIYRMFNFLSEVYGLEVYPIFVVLSVFNFFLIIYMMFKNNKYLNNLNIKSLIANIMLAVLGVIIFSALEGGFQGLIEAFTDLYNENVYLLYPFASPLSLWILILIYKKIKKDTNEIVYFTQTAIGLYIIYTQSYYFNFKFSTMFDITAFISVIITLLIITDFFKNLIMKIKNKEIVW